MGQVVPYVEGKLADEAVRFNSLAPPCSQTIVSFAHTFPILNLIVFPSHDEDTGVLVGVGAAVGIGRGVGVGTAVGIDLAVGVGTEVAVGTSVGVFAGAGLGVLVG